MGPKKLLGFLSHLPTPKLFPKRYSAKRMTYLGIGCSPWLWWNRKDPVCNSARLSCFLFFFSFSLNFVSTLKVLGLVCQSVGAISFSFSPHFLNVLSPHPNVHHAQLREGFLMTLRFLFVVECFTKSAITNVLVGYGWEATPEAFFRA